LPGVLPLLPIKVFRFAIQHRRTRHQTGPDTPRGPRDVALRWRATALRAARAAILWRASITDDGKDSVHAFTQALRHSGVATAPAAATRTAAQRRARVPPRRGRWREKVPDEASARRFVPEVMRGGDTGMLMAQQPCGTVQGRRTAPSHPAPQSCRKGWFAERVAGSGPSDWVMSRL